MKFEIIDVTPEKASEWLTHGPHNPRPLKKFIIDKYAQDMRQGHWRLTHQGIAFNKDGQVIDGQHRLSAIIKSGKTAKMAVFRDVEEDNFDVMDIGALRTRSDILAIEGIPPKLARILSPAIPYCVNYETYRILARKVNSRKLGNSNVVVRSFVEAHPEIISSAEFTLTLPRRDALLPDSQLCFLHYEISRYNADAEKFLYLLTTGDGVPSESPIFEMRRQLLSSKLHKYIVADILLLKRVVCTYNFYHIGKAIKDWRQALYHASNTEKVEFVIDTEDTIAPMKKAS